MNQESGAPLLLVDLDGVIIYGGNPSEGLPKEIVQLHKNMASVLASLEMPIVLYTHRSKFDAIKIRGFLEAQGIRFNACISAKDMFFQALRQFRIIELLRGGLSKKFAISLAEKKYNVHRRHLILIDDRLENLNEVLSEGLQLVVHAPFEVNSTTVKTFDFSYFIEILKSDTLFDQSGVISLPAVHHETSSLPVIGEIPKKRLNIFEIGRLGIKRLRKVLKLSQ